MVYPFIKVDGVVIREPATAITNYMICALCVFLIIKLKAKKRFSNSIKYWRLFFLFMAIATFVGGLKHAFSYYMTTHVYDVIWTFIQVCSGISIFFAQYAAIQDYFGNHKHKKWFVLVPLIQFIMFVPILIDTLNFSVVTFNVALGMLPIMFIAFYHYKKEDNIASSWIALGIFIAIFTAAVHALKLSFSIWFNYNDISHVMIMISLYFIYYGAMQIVSPQMTTERVTAKTK